MRFGKIATTIAGLGVLVVGFALSVAGGAILAATSSGDVSLPTINVRTDASAITTESLDVMYDENFRDPFLSVSIRETGDDDVFIGVGNADDVAAYLGETTSIVVAENRSEIITRGTTRVLTPPADESFWIATNVDGTFDWQPTEGEWALVVANADGTTGINTAVQVDAVVPFLRLTGGALLAAGLFGLGLGVFVTYLGIREPRAPAQTAGDVSVA